MRNASTRLLALPSLAVALVCPLASGQRSPIAPQVTTAVRADVEPDRRTTCSPSWLPTFGGQPGVGAGYVSALAGYDDGKGLAVYVGGRFQSAGGESASGIAKWTAGRWESLGSGVAGSFGGIPSVNALAVFDDGRGPALYMGGRFATVSGVAAEGIARWDGSRWMPVGSGLDTVDDLIVFDDGSGEALYASGSFSRSGTVGLLNVGKWDGANWSPLGGGLNGQVYCLGAFDDGSGPALYAGGDFSISSSGSRVNIARWDGTTWSPVGGGVDQYVYALEVFNDGNGPALYAGGNFSAAGGVTAHGIAKWDGSSWSPVGGGVGAGLALEVFDDGTGEALYVGGPFATTFGVATNCLTKWDGSSWTSLGFASDPLSTFTPVTTLLAFDAGTGPALYVGGTFASAGNVAASCVAEWSGSTWSALGGGINDTVSALAVVAESTGPALYAGGEFTSVGTAANGVAKWNGSTWSALGAGMDGPVRALAVFDDGRGSAVYAGGSFVNADGKLVDRVAKWNGVTWSTCAGGMNSPISPNPTEVDAFAVFDDGTGPALYAGGLFSTAGGAPAANIAEWDGSLWHPLGTGIGDRVSSNQVFALAVFDDGHGRALYVGGVFSTAGGVPAKFIAKWNGSTWSPVGGGLSWTVYGLQVFDDGSGPALYAAGRFTQAGGVAANYIAKWDGSTWSPLGSGVDSWVYSLAVFDDGTGPALYAGGIFKSAGGIAADGIAKWDGTRWSPLLGGVSGAGTTTSVNTMTVFDDGTGPSLFAGGLFGASPAGDSYLAKWGCTLPIGARTFGASTPACLGSVSIGVTSPPRVGNRSFAITCTHAPPLAAGVLLWGSALVPPAVLLGTQLWVTPILAQNTASDAFGGAEVALPIRRDPALVGARLDGQFVWFGPPTSPPCPTFGLSASNGITLTVQS